MGTPGILGDDVLLMIFEFLDVKNLCICEAVCSQWRTVLKSETPWRRLLGRQIAVSDLWRHAWLSMGLEDKKLTEVQCRTVCRTIGHYMRKMDDYWRAGNVEMTTYALGNHYLIERLKMGRKYISCVTTSSGRTFIRYFDKTTMQPIQSYENLNAIHAKFLVSEDIFLMKVPASSSTIQFYERETGQFIYSMDEEPTL
jgi:F-box-like